jgi:hypothetical protein
MSVLSEASVQHVSECDISIQAAFVLLFGLEYAVPFLAGLFSANYTSK